MAEGNIYPTLSNDNYGYSPKPLINFDNNYGYGDTKINSSSLAPKDTTEGGMNSAQQQMAGNAIGGGVDAGIKITQGLMQMSENDKARTEARGMAMQNRDDQLKQERIELGYRKRQQELEQQTFDTNKRIEKYNTKFSIWQNKFKRELENQHKSIAAADELFSLYNTSDEKTQQALVRSFI